jgi:hypothetical protein
MSQLVGAASPRRSYVKSVIVVLVPIRLAMATTHPPRQLPDHW